VHTISTSSSPPACSLLCSSYARCLASLSTIHALALTFVSHFSFDRCCAGPFTDQLPLPICSFIPLASPISVAYVLVAILSKLETVCMHPISLPSWRRQRPAIDFATLSPSFCDLLKILFLISTSVGYQCKVRMCYSFKNWFHSCLHVKSEPEPALSMRNPSSCTLGLCSAAMSSCAALSPSLLAPLHCPCHLPNIPTHTPHRSPRLQSILTKIIGQCQARHASKPT
jgi:hypothetical protein